MQYSQHAMARVFLYILLMTGFALAAGTNPEGGSDAITVPQLINYQGKLTDGSGNPVPNGSYNLTFRLYSGGTQYWTETQAVQVTDGLFNVLLGSSTPIGSIPEGGICSLEVVVGSEVIVPKIPIVSAAYSYNAQKADDADKVDGQHASAFAPASHTHTASGDVVGTVTGTLTISDGAVTMAKINQSGATAGQAIIWNGSAWEPQTPAVGSHTHTATGDVTGTVSGTLTLANSGVTPGSYTSANITVDSKGRVTAASNGGAGTVTSIGQGTTGSITLTPNPITSTGTVDVNTTWADNRFVNEGQNAGGDLTGTYPNPTLATSGVTAGTYGSGTQVAQVTVDAKGRVTNAANVTITGAPPTGAAGGDLTGTYPNPTLTTSGVTAGTYGSGTQVAQVTVDAKGRVTNAANVTITGAPPTGAAGGDLTGTYPNPSLAATTVTPGSYTNANITVDSKGRLTAASSGTAGSVTSVSQGTGITCTPNPITTTGTVAFNTSWGDGRYILNQYSSAQSANHWISGTGRAAQFYGVSASSGAAGIYGDGGSYAYGVYGTATSTSYAGIGASGGTTTHGIYSSANHASYFPIRAHNSNSSGTGILATGNGATGNYMTAGSGGAFTGNAFGDYGRANNSDGTGVLGVGNNNSAIYTYTGGSGGAFTGTLCGAAGFATNTSGITAGLYGWTSNATGFGVQSYNGNSSGTGAMFIGQGASGSFLTAGSGVAGIGTSYGVYGRATNTGAPSCGGYFANGYGSYAYVAYYNGTNYKILGGGTVSTVMATRDGRKALFCPEMPEPLLQDIGEARLNNGHCRVELDPLFLDCITVDEEHPLRVFISLLDDCNGVYFRRDKTGFDVYELNSGTSNARFAWTVYATWKGYENTRFPVGPGPLETKDVPATAPVPQTSQSVPAPEHQVVTPAPVPAER